MTRRSRTAVGFADQVLSGATNFGATLVAAKMLAPAELGYFAITAAVYMLVIVAARGLVSEPVVLLHSHARGSDRSEVAVAAGAMCGLGVLGGGLLAAGAVLAPSGLRTDLLILAVLLPALVLQDFLRFAALARAEPVKAAETDGAWLVLQLAAIAAITATGLWAPATVLAAWLVPGALSGVIGCGVLRIRPRLGGGADWLIRHGSIGARFAVDNIVAQNSGWLLLVALAVIATPEQVGYFRVAQAAFMPATMLYGGLRLAIVPELIRLRAEDLRIFHRVVRVAAVMFCTTSAIWGLALWFLPARPGRALFGESWALAHDLILPLMINVVAGGLSMAAFAGIRACGDARGSLRTRLHVAVLTFGVSVVGAILGSATGAAFGLAITAPVTATIWWHQFRRSQAKAPVLTLERAMPLVADEVTTSRHVALDAS
jgi:O-antigen/teichoic acid export membrane protein